MTDRPELELKVPAVAPLSSVKSRSLIAWETAVGLTFRLVTTTVSVFAEVVKAAVALTDPPGVLLPLGVWYVIDEACAENAAPSATTPPNHRLFSFIFVDDSPVVWLTYLVRSTN
jgi:hypothetical protein